MARVHGAGVIAISNEHGMYLLAIRQQNNKRTLRDYCIRLIEDRGVFVLPSVICKWFLHLFPFRGSLGKLNQVPLDNFSPENILRAMGPEHWEFISLKGVQTLSVERVSRSMPIPISGIHTISSAFVE